MTDDAATEAFERLAEIAIGRASLYRFLSESFRDPNIESVGAIRSGAAVAGIGETIAWLGGDVVVFNESLDMLGNTAEELKDQDLPTILRDLKVEYARLFIGSPRALVHPFASMQQANPKGAERLLSVGRSVQSVEAMYTDAGIGLVAEIHEPPDHISTELEFLYFLCEKEAEAWAESDNETARDWRSRQRTFVDEHLEEWGIRFFEAVIEVTSRDYYRSLATFGKVFLRMESGAFRPS